jgi:Domain of unknown function (DUF4114)/PEP-CTERM motif
MHATSGLGRVLWRHGFGYRMSARRHPFWPSGFTRGNFVKYRLAVVAAVLMLIAPVVSADSLDVVGGGATTWHPFETPATSGGTAFWNNKSYDGGPTYQCNIGYWLSAPTSCNGAFLASSPNVTPNYLGDATTGFGFTKAATTESVTVTPKLQVTGWASVDEFGWVDLGTNTLHKLFQGTGVVGTSQTFIPSASYGFYVTAPFGGTDFNSGEHVGGSTTYLSTDGGSTGSKTHFAVFQLAGNDHYMFGIEDMNVGADWDYNDMAFDIQGNPAVPEPATMVLLGSGLVGIATAARKRKKG